LSGAEIYHSSLLSVNEKDSNAVDFKLFPNPSNQYIKIDISGLVVDSALIYSAKGNLIERIEPINNKTIKVDISNYNEGIYMVKLVLVNGLTLSSKFVKG